MLSGRVNSPFQLGSTCSFAVDFLPTWPRSLNVECMENQRLELEPLLTDDTWERIAPLLPVAARTGRPRANDRRTLRAILHVLGSEQRWCDLPPALGSYVTAWRRYRDWTHAGVWPRVWRALCASLSVGEQRALEAALAKNPRARQSGVLEGKEIWVEPEALEAAIDALVSGYDAEGGVAAVMISNEGLEMSWGL